MLRYQYKSAHFFFFEICIFNYCFCQMLSRFRIPLRDIMRGSTTHRKKEKKNLTRLLLETLSFLWYFENISKPKKKQNCEATSVLDLLSPLITPAAIWSSPQFGEKDVFRKSRRLSSLCLLPICRQQLQFTSVVEVKERIFIVHFWHTHDNLYAFCTLAKKPFKIDNLIVPCT